MKSSKGLIYEKQNIDIIEEEEGKDTNYHSPPRKQ